jgi:hypothetical protein
MTPQSQPGIANVLMVVGIMPLLLGMAWIFSIIVLEPAIKFALARISLVLAPLALSGCCYFMPCHPATYIAGTVTDAVSHQPVSNAAVRLYGYKARTTPSGCFALGGADALPFEFGVSAPGYKPTIIKAVPGWYWATVELVPEDRPGASKSGRDELSQDRYNELSSKCR